MERVSKTGGVEMSAGGFPGGPGPSGNGNGNGGGGTNASCGQIEDFIDLVREWGDQNFDDIDNPDRARIRAFSNAHSGLFASGAVPNDWWFNDGARRTWWQEISLDINFDVGNGAFLADDPDDPYSCN